MDKQSRKQLLEQYKNRTVTGGIYYIKCNGNGRTWIKSTQDMVGEKNRFDFSVSINSCMEPAMLTEWNQYGADSFSLIILEEIKKKDTQTDREFADDIEVLLDMWLEKQREENLK